jgi:predicted permease
MLATRLGTGEALASNTLVISTAGAVFTVALWLTLLQTTLG